MLNCIEIGVTRVAFFHVDRFIVFRLIFSRPLARLIFSSIRVIIVDFSYKRYALILWLSRDRDSARLRDYRRYFINVYGRYSEKFNCRPNVYQSVITSKYPLSSHNYVICGYHFVVYRFPGAISTNIPLRNLPIFVPRRLTRNETRFRSPDSGEFGQQFASRSRVSGVYDDNSSRMHRVARGRVAHAPRCIPSTFGHLIRRPVTAAEALF